MKKIRREHARNKLNLYTMVYNVSRAQNVTTTIKHDILSTVIFPELN